MAVMRFVGALVMFLAYTKASEEVGEFTILQSPKYVHFLHTDDIIDVNEIPPVVLAYLGVPLNSDIKWKGLAEGNPFRRPKAAVIFSVDALPAHKLKLHHKYKYALQESAGEFDSDLAISHIQSLDWKKEPAFVDFAVDMSMVELKSHHPELFIGLPTTLGRVYEDALAGRNWFKVAGLGSLNVTNDADLQLAAELYLIKGIVNKLKQHPKVMESNSPDFYHFKINGLEVLIDTYGRKSQQVKDAVDLLNTVIEQVTEDFTELYSGNCVVQLVGFQQLTEEQRSRRGRSLLGEVEMNSNQTLNLAPEFTEMYPVIFNIILWTMIAMALAVYAISWGIWNMDPGRDSLIYRMTSQRKKND